MCKQRNKQQDSRYARSLCAFFFFSKSTSPWNIADTLDSLQKLSSINLKLQDWGFLGDWHALVYKGRFLHIKCDKGHDWHCEMSWTWKKKNWTRVKRRTVFSSRPMVRVSIQQFELKAYVGVLRHLCCWNTWHVFVRHKSPQNSSHLFPVLFFAKVTPSFLKSRHPQRSKCSTRWPSTHPDGCKQGRHSLFTPDPPLDGDRATIPKECKASGLHPFGCAHLSRQLNMRRTNFIGQPWTLERSKVCLHSSYLMETPLEGHVRV